MSRARSSTTSSVRSTIDSREAPLALNGGMAGGKSLNWRGISNGDSNTRHHNGDTVASSYASQHTLKTIRGHSPPLPSPDPEGFNSSDQRGLDGDLQNSNDTNVRRGNSQFIIDLESGTSAATRARSDTFGGVALPPSLPSKYDQSPSFRVQQRPTLARQDTDTSLSSLPSSLRLGGGTGDTFSDRRPILASALKALALFLLCLLALYITLHALLPPLDDEHRDKVKLPKSFQDLKELNEVLQVYKDRNYGRVLGCYITVYLFIQAFSIPGSMYLSILGGAMYGVVMSLPLVCFCVATGALICYYISALLGPAILLNSERWQARVDAWSDRVSAHRENLISYLIVIRIAPLPPHWVVNVVAPHLGISVWVFWISTFFGIAGVSYIHTTIGTTLDQMTSSSDFNLLSWQNGLGLGGIIVAVLVPVVLRRIYKKDLDDAAIEEPTTAGGLEGGVRAGRQSISLEADEDAGGEGDGLLARRVSQEAARRAQAAKSGPFRLDSPGSSEDEHDDDDDRDEAPEDEQGDRRAWTSAGQAGNLDKASRLLGVGVEREGANANAGSSGIGSGSSSGPSHDAWSGHASGNSPDRVW